MLLGALELARPLAGKAGPTLGTIKARMYPGALGALRDSRDSARLSAPSRLSRSSAACANLHLEQRLLVQRRLVGPCPPRTPNSRLRQQQVHDRRDVHHQHDDLEPGGLVDDLVDLQRDEGSCRRRRRTRPTAAATTGRCPRASAARRRASSAAGDQVQRRRLRVEHLLDRVDRARVRDVEVDLVEERLQRLQVPVEQFLRLTWVLLSRNTAMAEQRRARPRAPTARSRAPAG